MTGKQSNQEQTNAAYEHLALEIVELINGLQDDFMDHYPAPDSEGLTWANVGDLQEVYRLLGAARKFIRHEEEQGV
jgi:hypothetical protein